MSAYDRLRETADRQHINMASVLGLAYALELACEYIDNQQSEDAFVDFLAQQEEVPGMTAVECPKCGGWEARVEKVVRSTGDAFFPNANRSPDSVLAEDGASIGDYFFEPTDEVTVLCMRCDHRGPLHEFVDN